MATVITSSLVGVDINNYSSSAMFAVGTQVFGTNGSMFEYVNTLSAIPAYQLVVIDDANNASNATTTNAATGLSRLGVAQISIAVSCYGWVQRQGLMLVSAAANCDNGVLLFTTGTAGVVDDATVSNCLVLGLMTMTTISNATAITAVAAAPLQIGWYSNPA